MTKGSNAGSSDKGYTVTSSGTNSQGNHYCHRDAGNGSNAYHYSNANGSYYYSNPNGSTYYNSRTGYAQYTPPGPANSTSNSTSK